MRSHRTEVKQRVATPLVVLRFNVGPSVGYGHAMRSVTLGAELVECGFRVALLASVLPPLLSGRATRAGVDMHELVFPTSMQEDVTHVLSFDPCVVVVDGYDFGCDYVSAIENAGVRCVLIDDNGSPAAAVASLVVNQNPHASQDLYPGVENSRLLLGLRYALIRSEISDASPVDIGSGDRLKPKVLVAIGGTDVLSLTAGVAAALASDCHIDVWAASDQPISGVWQAPSDIASTLASSDAAVIGAGSTMWEAAFLGVPTVTLVVADNQVLAATAAKDLGVTHMIDCRSGVAIEAIALETMRLLKAPQATSEVRSLDRRFVDGDGANRVAMAIDQLVTK